jgi:mannose/fructose/N-acetylgalactosamine-specific phosphotransferase system component IIB
MSNPEHVGKRGEAPLHKAVEKSCEITVNLGNMQFIKIKSQASQTFQSADDKDLRTKEDLMWSDIGIDLRRGLVSTLSEMGKTTEADKEFFDLCKAKVSGGKTTQEKSQ